jgi:MtfA peptidase
MRFFARRHRHDETDEPVELTTEQRRMLQTRWPIWKLLSTDEQARMEPLIVRFIDDKRWEAANGFEITDPIQVLVAAQACLLILERDYDDYRGVKSILIHKSTVVLRGQRSTGTAGLVSSDPYRIDGQAQLGGPIMLSWDAAAYDARHPIRGQNVIFHEFAHKLDMLDGIIDGTPPIRDDVARARWVEVCTREFKRLRRSGDPTGVVRDYGAENPGEFFAVVTEAFFSRPLELRAAKPELYDVLAGFYRQDPALRHPQPEAPAVAG